MKLLFKLTIILFLLLGLVVMPSVAQDKSYTLTDCINHALKNSTAVGRASNEVLSQVSELEQLRAERSPDLSLSASEYLSSSNSYEETDDTWDREGRASTSVSLSSDLTLYNGASIRNSILQGKINVSAAEADIKTTEDLLSLDVLADFIAVLQSQEQLKNSQSQLLATEEEMEEANIRREAGVLSPADYLYIKSQYASDKAELVTSKSELRISLVSLMQTMNMPISNSFSIIPPSEETILKLNLETDASTVYQVALGIYPSVKTATLDLESSLYDIKIAKADALPYLNLSSGLSTSHSSSTNTNIGNQLSNKITPTIGLELSVPIFRQKKVKNSVRQAVIDSEDYEFDLIDIKNDLRKSIEQACTDAQTANSTYVSYQELYLSEQESYKLAKEMFEQGMLSSVDYMTSKNNLSTAENNLTNAKYDMVLQNEIIEYYMGNSIEF